MTTTATTAPRTRASNGRKPSQGAAVVVSLFLIVAGILGFIPGIVPHLGDIRFVGPDSNAFVFNVFQTSILLNIVYIVLGLAGLGASRKSFSATGYILGMAFMFFVLFVYALMFGNSSYPGNIFAMNLADFSFLIGFSVAMVILGLATSPLALEQ
jgi:hypothetical protein